ncbi:FMN-dependent NADH-azoreductase [Salinibius halmophilus]|uniref:FMN-dependent NADH-azoreductase n=1 Tax=Salinibius halmophilus TaxID=1853216 RepID=UPI000E671D46|nr:NAD(P)H-dependent oxidoreductase [Salinibius halmophilus]
MKVLFLSNGIFGDNSQSNRLARSIIEKLSAKHSVELIERDLVASQLPMLDATVITALNTPAEERSAEQNSIVELSDTLIEELRSADAVVLSLPMYNFSIPAQLKAWVDLVARAGVTFQYTENGPQGLLADKPVYVATARGGFHKGNSTDAQTNFINTIFPFFGLTSVQFVYAEGLNISEEHKAKALAEADKAIDEALA